MFNAFERRAAQSVYRDAQTYGLGWHFPSQWYAWAAAYAQALAEEVIDRASLMQQVAAALPQNGGEQGIIIIGGMLEDFVDSCGTGKILQLFPPPRPHPDPNPRLTPCQLVLIAAQFQNAANANTSHGVRQEFTKASEQLLKTGMGRLQSTATAVGAG